MLKVYKTLHIPTATCEQYLYTKPGTYKKIFRTRAEDEITYIAIKDSTFLFVTCEAPDVILARRFEFCEEEYKGPLTSTQLYDLRELGVCFL